MNATADDVRAPGEQDAGAAQGRAELDIEVSAEHAVWQIAEWVPEAYRQAYLDGAAGVLGHAP